MQCFACQVKLDGWEPTDDPMKEHLAHSDGCAWATALSVRRDDNSQQEPEQRDPLSEEMIGARRATFQHGHGWPHESKKGWKCKITKMVEAGWAWDPNEESEDRDGVTCFYCDLSLDGWEPKDDPFVEHKRREPECPFFTLLEHYHGKDVAGGKAKKGKARGKASARTSTASKASRMSVQSAMSEVPSVGVSFADLGIDGSQAGADDSIVTTATVASQAATTGAGKGRKKAARPKAAAKGTKGRKKAPTDEDAMEVNYPELNPPEQRVEEEDEITGAPPKPTRKGTKAVLGQLDSSVVEISQMEAVPKKATKGRKPKVQKQPEPQPEELPQTPDVEAIAEQRISEISAQLRDELDHTVDDLPLDQSTPVAVAAPKPKRGVKRTSDGARKHQSSDSSAFEMDVPLLPAALPVVKAKRDRKPKQTSNASTEAEQENRPTVDVEGVHMDLDVTKMEELEPASVPKKTRGRPKGKKNSSARSSNSSQETTALEPGAHTDELGAHRNEPQNVVKKARGRPRGSRISSARSSQAFQESVRMSEPDALVSEELPTEELQAQPEWPRIPRQDSESLARDDLEIESELVRIASEQTSYRAMELEQEQLDEYETSPSKARLSKDSAEIKQLEQEIQNEEGNAAVATTAADFPPRLSLGLEANDGFTFSPSGSDKENQPSSIRQLSAKRPVFMSPTKTTRIPLAPGTPNRSPTRMLISPSKAEISRLASKRPWVPVDLDTAFLASPQPTPGRVGQQLVDAAGALSSPERKMTVEQWVRYRAEQTEEILRRKCEQMVAAFEKEGMRGLESLNEIAVVG